MSNDTCETCNDSGYVWVESDSGPSTMCDCPDDNCNAFGQVDFDVTCTDCGEIVPDGGDGFGELCGNCADKVENT